MALCLPLLRCEMTEWRKIAIIFYTQFDSIKQKSFPYYAIQDDSGAYCYPYKNQSDSIYGDSHFPFFLFDAIVEKARISWNDRLIELILDDTSTWKGLSPSEYERQRDAFFRKHDPIPTIRIMTYILAIFLQE